MHSLFGTHNHNIGSPLCYNLVGYNDNSDTFLTIDIYFLSVLTPGSSIKILLTYWKSIVNDWNTRLHLARSWVQGSVGSDI